MRSMVALDNEWNVQAGPSQLDKHTDSVESGTLKKYRAGGTAVIFFQKIR